MVAAAMQGRVCLITGATSGIGLVTARVLAQQGATVLVVGRDAARGAAAVRHIREASGNADVALFLADLSVQGQVRRLAAEVRRRFSQLHVLINNAGALFSRRTLSADGIEMTFALNHLAYFLLTHLLLDRLKASAPARIINVASDAHRSATLDFADVQGARRYNGWRAYCQSKLANVLFTYELARRLQGSGVTANALHPGFVATRFGHNNRGLCAWTIRLAQLVALSPERGAETVVYLATAPEVAEVSGAYFVKKRPVSSSPASYDVEAARRLWQLSAALTGLAPDPAVA
ncbi:MAG: short-chain dehydrogenase [Candidatus Tectimicrobiota bacterium]|nr:MAG: short-chain dehydrogenase [Candidatus Tectomicrobia bacterium]